MTESNEKPSIFGALAKKFSRGAAHSHLFVCGGPDCCTPEEGLASYRHARQAIRERGADSGEHRVKCTKTGCLGVCGNGPIAVVYPDRVWYDDMTAERLDKVIDEHCIGGKPVDAYSFEPPPEAHTPLD